jgi:hypothetical protein
MAMPVEQTWTTREQPILEAIFAGEEAGKPLNVNGVVATVSLPRGKVENALRSLRDAGFINALDASDHDGFDLMEIRLLERGRRAVGQWPSEDRTFETFLSVLKDQAASESDPERRSRIQRFLEAATTVGSDVASGFLTAFLKHMTGLQ